MKHNGKAIAGAVVATPPRSAGRNSYGRLYGNHEQPDAAVTEQVEPGGLNTTTTIGQVGEPDEPTEPPELAMDPNLLDTIAEDLAAMGLVGERENGQLVYLCYTSRKLGKPLSPIIRGPSGSGKDELERRPADLMPTDDVIDAMRLTPQALYHGEPGWLKNKLVLGGERSHVEDEAQRDRTAAIRQMLSHGYITKALVVEGKTRHIRQDGPICYSETTTKATVFDEDLNRCVQLWVDASEEQTRRVLEAVAARYKPGDKPDVVAIKKKHHAFQQWLAPVEVLVPFADLLAKRMPTNKVHVRRVFGQLLGLIQVVAFLYQAQRQKDENGCLVATFDDYDIARRLLLGPLHRSIGKGNDHANRAEIMAKLPNNQFTTTIAMHKLGIGTNKVCIDQLNRLANAGLVIKVKQGVGKQSTLWAKTEQATDDLLPTVEALEQPTQEEEAEA